MAELNLGKGLTAGKVASNVQKKLTRAQEKVRAPRLYDGVCMGTELHRTPRREAAAALPHRVASRHKIKCAWMLRLGTGLSSLKK